MKTKTIFPIAVVAIFMTLVFVPAISATEVRIAWVENPDGAVQVEKIDLKTEDYTTFVEILESFGAWMKEVRPFSDYTLDDTEITQIKGYINELKGILEDSTLLETLTPEMLVELILSSDASGGILKCCVLSVGWGKSLMPFNPYEWGFSGGTPFVRPLTFLQFPGYTGVIKYRFPLGAMGYDKMGTHLITVQGLQGLWIDGGSLGYKRQPFSFGIELVIGRGRVFAIGRH
ncbi:MAG: hypothetical protein NTV74_05705 [Euryarchaeota archaeon]|nr:hypothetical protein [Euryarchaeota archaeon]